MLSVLVEGTVEVRTLEDEYWVAVVDAGFLSVANNRVSILVRARADVARDRPRGGRRDLEEAAGGRVAEDPAPAAAEAGLVGAKTLTDPAHRREVTHTIGASEMLAPDVCRIMARVQQRGAAER